MAHWLNLADSLEVNVGKYPDKTALLDAERSFTWTELDQRVNRLANALLAMGLGKGDRVALLLENCLEIVELLYATARTGIVAVPINFRCVANEVGYITDNCEAKAFFVHDIFTPNVEPVRECLEGIPPENYILVGDNASDSISDSISDSDGPYRRYGDILASASPEPPDVVVRPEDTWIMLYTSGTTGTPKGVVRSHESYTAFYLINAIDFSFSEDDICMNIMPLCHVNSTFFTLAVLYVGGSVYVHPASHFDAAEVLRIIDREGITFISFVPTHYRMLLAVPEKERMDLTYRRLKKLLCSSAPATVSMKEAVVKFFDGVDLYEGYGSTEAGIVTVLKPHEQFTKPGSIGRESTGTSLVKILDESKQPLPDGEVGELYSRGPMLLTEYYNMPEKTASSFAGEWFTAGDMAFRDEDGYFFLVDRKDNMIITGGEKVFPSEVEAFLCNHPAVFDAAVVGIPDEKWGELVTAIVVLKEGMSATEHEIVEFCRGKISGYKRPKKAIFIPPAAMPRTATGKILHRQLRARFGRI